MILRRFDLKPFDSVNPVSFRKEEEEAGEGRRKEK